MQDLFVEVKAIVQVHRELVVDLLVHVVGKVGFGKDEEDLVNEPAQVDAGFKG